MWLDVPLINTAKFQSADSGWNQILISSEWHDSLLKPHLLTVNQTIPKYAKQGIWFVSSNIIQNKKRMSNPIIQNTNLWTVQAPCWRYWESCSSPVARGRPGFFRKGEAGSHSHSHSYHDKLDFRYMVYRIIYANIYARDGRVQLPIYVYIYIYICMYIYIYRIRIDKNIFDSNPQNI